jgi:hypothetical protein
MKRDMIVPFPTPLGPHTTSGRATAPPPPTPPAAAVPTRPGLDDDFDGWVDTDFDNDEDEDDDDPPASDKFVGDIGRDVA